MGLGVVKFVGLCVLDEVLRIVSEQFLRGENTRSLKNLIYGPE